MSLEPMLKGEAKPCLTCTAKTCAQAVPYAAEVTRLFAEDKIAEAYAIIRKYNVLPEMSARVCPSFGQAEQACVEKQEGRDTVPVREIVHAVAQLARQDRLTGVKTGVTATRKKVAVIGGGPAGIAAAVRLLEFGHHVVLFEREASLGGAPAQLYRTQRFGDGKDEIDALLQRALNAHTLEIRYHRQLGKQVKLHELRQVYGAVVLATGLWKEYPFAPDAEQVVDAITFLREVKSGTRTTVPEKVAIIAGGDAAMDAAAAAQALGAQELNIVFPDRFENMHWHMPADWFETSGAQMLDHTQPLGFDGGLVCCKTEYVNDELYQVADSEALLPVDLVISASGLTVADRVSAELDSLTFSGHGLVAEQGYATSEPGFFVAGALMNGGMAVSRCVQDGMGAAEAVNEYLAKV